MASASLAHLRVVARVPDKVYVLDPASSSTDKAYARAEATSVLPYADGSRLVAVRPTTISLVDPTTSQEVGSIGEAGVLFTALSPAGGYLVTVQRPVKGEDGQPIKNLKVWDLSTCGCVLSLSQKAVNKDAWPALQWAADDSCVMHMMTNTLHCYNRADGFAAYKKLAVKGVGGFAISPGPLPRLAAFMPEVKASPAAAAVYDWSIAANGGPGGEPTQLVRKGFFRCQGATLLWNAPGTAVLALAYADFDATNQSYYGEQKLHYLPAEAKDVELAVTVPLPKDGPVHDVKWTPAGDFFVAVAGFMPAKVTLFDAKCKPVYDLGSGPYNLVWWSPFGRFLAVAGFGNLPGDILFYDKKSSGTLRQMGAVRCPAVTADWSPDGRHFLVATTAPRLRVDNGFKVFTYHGTQVSAQSFPVLLDAAWLPAPKGTYTDRPQSPERLAAAGTGSSAAGGDGGGKSSVPVGPVKTAAYRPPHAKMGLVGNTPAATFSLGHDASDAPGRIGGAAGGRTPPMKPGAEFISKGASANAKKRAAKKNKAASGGAGGGDEGGEEDGQDDTGLSTASASGAGQQQHTVANGAEAGNSEGGGEGADALAKRVKALQKKLRQIQQLKDKAAAEGESSLEPEQKVKLQGEAALLAELQGLGIAS